MRLFLLFLALALTGCASDYKLYADASAKSEIARHNADAAKYRAMADIAAQGDASAKVAAVMAIALGQQSTAQTQLRPPEHATGTLLQWAQVLVNPLTQMYGAYSARRVGESQASYSFQGLKSTNDTFGLIASKIQAPTTPAPNVTTTNTTTTNTDRHDVTTSMTDSTGVLGSGTYNPVSTTTPAPVVITPVVQVVPTVITPVAPAPIVPTVITPVVQIVPIVPTP